MSRRYESPENVKRTNPYEYQHYENIKERHYYGKYNPCEKVDFDCDYPEAGAFCLEKNNDENAKEKYEFEDCELKGKLKIKLAIKSLLMNSDD